MKTQQELMLPHDGSALMPEVVDGKVDARAVHEALEIGERFTQWIQRRIDEFGFSDGEDFFRNFGTSPLGRPRTEFLLTLDMAKELAMVERNEMGRKMRRYFIECEKRLRDAIGGSTTPALPSSALAKIQQINAVLIEEMQGHAARIEKLEVQSRPGPEWISVVDWFADHPAKLAELGWQDDPLWRQQNRQKFASLASIAAKLSAAQGLACGWERRRVSGHAARTYRPDIVATAVERKLKNIAQQKGGMA